jgi:GNAT superfamily N-acetyltransferase
MDPPHIAIRPLNSPDFLLVQQLETLGFPPGERCSELGIKYRLKTCPELCSGLFIREFSNGADDETDREGEAEGEDAVHNDIVGNGAKIIKETLVGHILGTKIPGQWITEEAMEVPDSFAKLENGEEVDDVDSSSGGVQKGHVESSTTIGIHSLVIHADHQKKNLATLLMNDYIQKLSSLSVGDRIVIISKKKLIPFYERLNFVSKGKSACTHGGEEWYDLVRVLEHEDDEL